ncbi:VOC family protein [Enterococcus sp. 2201sp1_2201st1_B8_2201SCRN_220225]|uniref:VOC family protein n=1 Tax=unclassified Enterococcus TaxID=2608891 RepID=UPI0034A1EB11
MLTKTEFKIDAGTKIGYVALKVANLEKMTNFYQEIIGLTLLGATETESRLGVADSELLRLRKISDPRPQTRRTGLYHVAFLLPTRWDLGNALFHYLQAEAPLTGASDHGYSEALYLTDPEGNGIEVYHDKARSQWDIRENGEIIGVVEPMDTEGVLDAADRNWAGFVPETTVGHVHLKVADLKASDRFYTEIMGLTLTSNFGAQAKFFAAGSYHHHLGANNWLGANVPAMTAQDLGLDYYTYQVPNATELERLGTHFSKFKVDFEVENGQLRVKDPNGILVVVERLF